MKRFSYLFLIALLPLMMMACSGSQSDEDAAKEQAVKDAKEQEAKDAVKKKTLPICPQVAIVHELDTLRDYGTEKPDASELVAVARMQNVEGDCGYQKDGIDIAFDLNFIAQRGPRLGGDRVSFPFFVAVVDPDEKVLNKDRMTTEFKLGDDPKKVVDKTEHLHVLIPMAKEKWETGPNYQVLIGFQLTQAQLDAVRARGPKPPEEKKPAPDTSAQKVPAPPAATPPAAATAPTPAQESLAPKTLDQELPVGITPQPPTSDQPTPDQPASGK